MFYLATITANMQIETPEEPPELYPTLRQASDALNEFYQDSLDAYTAGNLESLDFNLCVVRTPFDEKETAFIYRIGWHEAFFNGSLRHHVIQDIKKARREFTEEELPPKIFAVLNHLALSLPAS